MNASDQKLDQIFQEAAGKLRDLKPTQISCMSAEDRNREEADTQTCEERDRILDKLVREAREMLAARDLEQEQERTSRRRASDEEIEQIIREEAKKLTIPPYHISYMSTEDKQKFNTKSTAPSGMSAKERHTFETLHKYAPDPPKKGNPLGLALIFGVICGIGVAVFVGPVGLLIGGLVGAGIAFGISSPD
jgi:hypothetical protein